MAAFLLYKKISIFCLPQDACPCFNPNEALAAQALFSDPTSVTVTPDGVVHLSDMGNLRVFSVVSELPALKNGHYEVVAPETQQLYIFNMYGQHRHTVNINTGQYVYNFTYTRFSSYGKLQSVSDSANNVIQIEREGDHLANRIVAPSGQACELEMNERGLLQKFTSSIGNMETSFSYTVPTGLLQTKEDSWGQTYLYAYDETGRLLSVRQPTGQVTSLTTDINTSGSIVRMATGSRHVSAMATYGSVQSVLHGKCLLIYLFSSYFTSYIILTGKVIILSKRALLPFYTSIKNDCKQQLGTKLMSQIFLLSFSFKSYNIYRFYFS